MPKMENGRMLFSSSIVTNGMGGIAASGNAPTVGINEGHTLVVNDYDHVLKDYLKRDFAIGLKVNSVRATGYPHTWNEQTKLPSNAVAVDPKMGFGTTTPSYARPASELDTDYGRDNWKNALTRCYASRIQYDFFQRQMEANYGSFEDLTAKDYNDMFVDFAKVTAHDFWNGRATALDDTTSTYHNEYMGVLSQITDVSAIGAGKTIANALNTKIASLQSRLDYSNMPDVIAMNAATYDLLVNEEQERSIYMRQVQAELLPGFNVPGFNTYAGNLPIVISPWIKPVTKVDGSIEHKIVALNSSMIDRVWMFADGPQVYEIASPDMPLNNDRLLTDKMVLDFSTYILHGAHTGAHFILTKTVSA